MAQGALKTLEKTRHAQSSIYNIVRSATTADPEEPAPRQIFRLTAYTADVFADMQPSEQNGLWSGNGEISSHHLSQMRFSLHFLPTSLDAYEAAIYSITAECVLVRREYFYRGMNSQPWTFRGIIIPRVINSWALSMSVYEISICLSHCTVCQTSRNFVDQWPCATVT